MATITVRSIGRQVRAIIFEELERAYADNSRRALTNEADLSRDLGLDSLHIVDIFAGIEEAFEIEIPDDDAQRLLTIGQIVNYVAERLAEVDSPLAIGAA